MIHYRSFGREVIYIIDIEASLDNLPWQAVGSVAIRRDSRKTGAYTVPLDLGRVFLSLSPLPHHIDFRATYKVLDAITVPQKSLSEVFESSEFYDFLINVGPFEGSWPVLRRAGKPLFTETRALGTFSVSLFDHYPDYFPRKVSLFPGAKPLDSYLHLERIRIVRLKLLQHKAFGIKFALPDRSIHCLANDDVPKDGVLAVELLGRMDSGIPVPLADDARVYALGFKEPLLDFPFVLGLAQSSSNFWWQSTFRASEVFDGGARFYLTAQRALRSPHTVLNSLNDQTTEGFLTLSPSRSVALGTQSFDRYLDKPLSLPILFEIKTIAAEGADTNTCPTL